MSASPLNYLMISAFRCAEKNTSVSNQPNELQNIGTSLFVSLDVDSNFEPLAENPALNVSSQPEPQT